MSCVFCDIVMGTVPCHKIAETENEMAFLDIMPLTRGHVVVIPKHHVALAYDAPPDMMGKVMEMATRISAAAKLALECAGFNFVVNCGASAGQVVPHVHLHLIPRYENDGIHWPWSQGSLTNETAAELVKQIAERLG